MRMKMKWKKRKKFWRKYINGTKGAISLFLAVTMSPLLSITLLLVESDRYQCAAELMKEVADCSAFSSLAEYDSYLDERFGVLAVSQEEDINSSFKNYLDSNKNVLGNDVTVRSQDAQGKYPLSNTRILKQQILEYSELSVATEVLTEGLDLENLLNDLEKKLKLDEIKKEIDNVNKGIDLAKEVEKLVEALMDTKGQHDAYADALEAYKTEYSNFEKKAVALAKALQEAKENLSEDDEEEDIYSNQSVKEALEAASSAKEAYKKKNAELKTELSKMQKCLNKIFSSLNKLPSKIQSVNEAMDTTLEEKCTTSTFDWIILVVDQVTTFVNNDVGDDYESKINTELHELDNQAEKLGKYTDRTIGSDWDAKKVQKEYGIVNISTISESFGGPYWT